LRNSNYIKGSLSRIAWKKFKSNRLALACLIIICTTAFFSIFGYFFIPDSTPFANHQQLELSTRGPASRAIILHVKKNQEPLETTFFERLVSGKPTEYTTTPIQSYQLEGSWIKYVSDTGHEGFGGMELQAWLPDVVFAILPDQEQTEPVDGMLSFVLVNGQVKTMPVETLHQIVTEKHIRAKRFWLGTDRFGRDMLSQLVIGARVSLSVGFIAVFISLVIGLTLGCLAGYFRGWIDDLIVWLINVVWSIPTLLLVIAITFAIGKGFWQIFVAVGLTMWVEVARVARGQVMSLREKEFVEAAKALGLGSYRIITRHILPNIMGPIIVISAANFASAILIEAGLSFLGIGVQPPMPSWGTMIREHYGYLVLGQPYLALFPGLLIMLMVLAFMVIGNGLREALDKTPR